MQVVPYRSDGSDIVGMLEMIVNDEFQVTIDREYYHAVQVGQYGVYNLILLVSCEGVQEDGTLLFLAKQFCGNPSAWDCLSSPTHGYRIAATEAVNGMPHAGWQPSIHHPSGSRAHR
jgi:hypothetical protein